MKIDIKKLTSRAFLIYALVKIFTYLFAHVAYLFANDVMGELFEYVSYYISKSVEFLAPPVIATFALFVLIEFGRASFVKFTLALSSARALYSIPYYYIIFIYNYGYDSVEAIIISLVATVLVILLTFIGVLISLLIYRALMKRYCKKTDTSPEVFLPSLLTKSSCKDFLSPNNVPLITFALVRFSFSFIMELFDTVTFFIEYRSDYMPKEIITKLLNFVLLFLLLIVSYLTASILRNAAVKEDTLQ